MGTHNRITKEKYQIIKKDCTTPSNDHAVMVKHGIGITTARNIRNTTDYSDYCERVFRYHGHPKRSRGSVVTEAPQRVNDSEAEEAPVFVTLNFYHSLTLFGIAIILLLAILFFK